MILLNLFSCLFMWYSVQVICCGYKYYFIGFFVFFSLLSSILCIKSMLLYTNFNEFFFQTHTHRDNFHIWASNGLSLTQCIMYLYAQIYIIHINKCKRDVVICLYFDNNVCAHEHHTINTHKHTHSSRQKCASAQCCKTKWNKLQKQCVMGIISSV